MIHCWIVLLPLTVTVTYRSVMMIEKLLNEKSEVFSSIQALVSLVCESTSDRGKALLHQQVSEPGNWELSATLYFLYSLYVLYSTNHCIVIYDNP